MSRTVKMEHGSGGFLSRDLVERVIHPCFKGDAYPVLSDASPIEPGSDLLFTTDGYVVDPPFFPGGDIGMLAVYGTCNDLSVSGARPLSLSLGIVVEEGFPLDDLERVCKTAAAACREAGVSVVTGDTKVVPRGKGGGIFLTTAGIGRRVFPHPMTPERIKEGDRLIVSAPVGGHGLAILAARESLPVGASLRSDAAPLHPLCSGLFTLGEELRFIRDATRGGVAAVLNEIVSGASFGAVVREEAFPVTEDVRAAAEILGLNPLEIANEGVLVAVVASSVMDRALEILRGLPLGKGAVTVGSITSEFPGEVMAVTRIGGRRRLDFPRGLLLPRIC